MTKEIEKTTSTEVTSYDPKELGASSEITASDITIGRISVMQAMSVLVANDEAKKGEIVNLDTLEVLGNQTQECEVILLKSFKYWITKKGEEFVSKEPAVSPEDKPWEDGVYKNMYHHAFYVLLPSEIAAGVELPYEIAFRSTDLASAKKISKFLLAMRRKEQASWSKIFTLKTVEKTKDKYKWFATEVGVGRDSTEAEKVSSYEWFKQIANASSIKEARHDDIVASGQVSDGESF